MASWHGLPCAWVPREVASFQMFPPSLAFVVARKLPILPCYKYPHRPGQVPCTLAARTHLMVSQAQALPPSSSSRGIRDAKLAAASMDSSPAPPLLLGAPTTTPSIDLPATAKVFDLRREEPKIPTPFVWPHDDARPTSAAELDVPVVDVGVLRNGDRDGLRRAAAQVASACAAHGFFQVCGHGVDASLARAALDGASDFFRLPLAEKQRARRVPGTVSGYTSAHADRFASKLPWKETLSFGFHDGAASPVVVDYFTGTLGRDFEPMGRVYQRYCEEMKALSLTIMELLELSLGVERGYYRDFFEDSRSIMRCNYYPPCPEPERTLGTGPHCDPTALTILLQDHVGGLEVLVDGDWRPVRPVPGAMVINIGDTFMPPLDVRRGRAFESVPSPYPTTATAALVRLCGRLALERARPRLVGFPVLVAPLGVRERARPGGGFSFLPGGRPAPMPRPTRLVGCLFGLGSLPVVACLAGGRLRFPLAVSAHDPARGAHAGAPARPPFGRVVGRQQLHQLMRPVSASWTRFALSNGRYKSCLHRAVVNRRQERRSLAFFLCPREDRVVRPPASGDVTVAPRRYPDFTWADLMRFTQRHYRADTRTLDAFTRWLAHAPAQEAAAAP
ncbi:hypothetical protein HU200_067089 [Digitaria exilis]|uniref:Fe2OG dioxygenase domain-containing protein n=1 Tax=Digitaria exilis TaxID=1010633 RepID=A0A835A018_9POAL|nr:hypothetical protein HU200_067089 [Digitaria exilis]